MHRALQIPELLLNIFCRHGPSSPSDADRKGVNRDLAALARTCRAFKEPALDVLWSELQDPSPLIRCLPDISQWTSPTIDLFSDRFTRPLEQIEWNVLSGYARRIWYMGCSELELNWESVRPSVDFTPADPLFPNLRALRCQFTRKTASLLQLPFPSLIRLHIQLPWDVDIHMLQRPLTSLAMTSSNIKTLGIGGEVPFDVNMLVHLSRLPMLTRLSFTLDDTFLAQTIPSDSLPFTALDSLELHVKSLVPISRLLSWARLPSITDLDVTIDDHSSKQELRSFMISIQTAKMCRTVRKFSLDQVDESLDITPRREQNPPLLDLDDLRPCMAFHNLRHMNLDLEWDVTLSSDQLLILASAWPQLEALTINRCWGWNRPGGITPNGLASLLQMCPSLTRVALAIDTRGYTRFLNMGFSGPHSTPSSAHLLFTNVLDSIIEEESVDAMADFICSIVSHSDFDFTAWATWSTLDHPDPNLDLYRRRWKAVYWKAKITLMKARGQTLVVHHPFGSGFSICHLYDLLYHCFHCYWTLLVTSFCLFTDVAAMLLKFCLEHIARSIGSSEA